ncbi:MAG: hypothetical protein IPG50_27760 [Myxococcales bacterium]|nr:hypothetical protein [Myxococcales bacterium]
MLLRDAPRFPFASLASPSGSEVDLSSWLRDGPWDWGNDNEETGWELEPEFAEEFACSDGSGVCWLV